MKFRAPSSIPLCKLSIVACSLGAFASFPDAALAQVCAEDVDCAPEDYCSRYPLSGQSSGSSEGSSGSSDGAAPCAEGEECPPLVPPEEEELLPASEGQCERGGRSCTGDDECLAEHYCSFDDVDVVSSTCAEGEDCPDIAPPPPSGRCEHEPYTCAVDADCPEPTVCGEDGECILELQVCESDGDCNAGYECLSMRGEGTDSTSVDDSAEPPMAADAKPPSSGAAQQDPAASSGGGSSSGADDPVAVDDLAAAAPPKETGTEPVASSDDSEPPPDEGAPRPEEDPPTAEETGGFCFPNAAACESDEDCEDGWVCVEVDGAPSSWGDIEFSCVPPGLAAAIEGDLEIEGGGIGENTSEDGSLDPRGEDPSEDEDTNENETPIGEDDSDGVDGLGTQGGSEGAAPSNGCSVRGSTSAHGYGLAGLAALLGLTLFSRRQRRGLLP